MLSLKEQADARRRDKLAREMVPGFLPEDPRYVYRLFSDTELLYVGITRNLQDRFFRTKKSAHTGKEWFPEVAYLTVEKYHDLRDGLDAEAHAIRGENPRYNIAQPRPTAPLPRSLGGVSGPVADLSRIFQEVESLTW